MGSLFFANFFAIHAANVSLSKNLVFFVNICSNLRGFNEGSKFLSTNFDKNLHDLYFSMMIKLGKIGFLDSLTFVGSSGFLSVSHCQPCFL